MRVLMLSQQLGQALEITQLLGEVVVDRELQLLLAHLGHLELEMTGWRRRDRVLGLGVRCLGQRLLAGEVALLAGLECP